MSLPRNLLFFIAVASPLIAAKAQTSLVPTSPQWHPNEILNWNPATDPSAPYARSTVPLAPRISVPTAAQNAGLNALWNVNTHARPNEGRIQTVISFNSIPAGGAQGWRTTKLYAPTFWQYNENMVFWGSSDRDTRVILAPTAHVIDAAHRNGVPVYGKIFFGWNGSPDNASLQRIRDLLQKTGSTFPVADKLVDVAKYYGFDGWFINQENYQTNSTDAQNMRDFIAYYRANAPATQKIIWYDAMAENGSRSFQNALTSVNDGYLKEGSTLRAQMMFLNFWWGADYNAPNNIPNSRTLAQGLGLSPYDIYAGIDTEGAGYTTTVPDWLNLFPEGSPHRVSLGIYRPEWTFNSSSSTDPHDAITREIRYWCGQNADPANTSIPSGSSTPEWAGLAHYIPANSSITTKPFVTHFNVGQGTQAAVNGTLMASGPWTNLSTQDILPTWKWNITTTGTRLSPSFDFSDPYYGGTSLKVSGTLNATNDLRLYQTQLAVTATTKLDLVYKRGATGASALQVGLAFEDNPSVFEYLNVGNSPGTGWNPISFPLSSYAGRKIVVIALRFANGTAISGYSMKIGRLAIQDGASVAPAAPANVVIDAQNSVDADAISLRLRWTPSADPVRQYNVYLRYPDNSRIWVGASLNSVYFLPAARRKGGQSTFTVEVEAVSPTFGTSSAAVGAAVTIPAGPNLAYPFITNYSPLGPATIIGTEGAWSGAPTRTKDKVFDNSLTTYFDAPTTDGCWAGLDLGAGNTRPVTAISYCPRPGWASRMTGGRFEASNTADFSSGVTLLATVEVPPTDGAYTTIAIQGAGVFRYVRYLSPGGGSCNVAEVKFYGSGPTGETLQWNTGSGTWNSTAGNTVWSRAGTPVPWSNDNGADFGGSDTARTITLAENVTPTTLSFDASGYTLTASSPMTIDLGTGMTIAAGKTATIGNRVTVQRASAFTYWGSGTLVIDSGGTFRHTGTGTFGIGGPNTIVDVRGTLERTSADESATANITQVANGAGDDVTILLKPGGTWTGMGRRIDIGTGVGSHATIAMTGGTLSIPSTVAGRGSIVLGTNTGAEVDFDMSGGSLSLGGGLILGNTTDGESRFHASGGSITAEALVFVDQPRTNITAEATLSNSATMVLDSTMGGIVFHNHASATGNASFHLDGGTVTTPGVKKVSALAGAVAVANFNGGTMKANVSTTTFMGGLNRANVRNGGAVIDTNGFNITIAQSLQHSDIVGDAAIDGGLTKRGTGVLSLTGSGNNYTGDSRVEAGDLSLGAATLNDAADVRLAEGTTLTLAHGAADTIRSLYLGGVQMAAGTYVAPGSATSGIATPYLAGMGSLVVTADAHSGDFDAWAAGLPAGQRGRSDDPDGDGASNLEEFLFGTNGGAPNGSLWQGGREGSQLVLHWLERAEGATYQLQEGLPEGSWTPSPVITQLALDQTGVAAGYVRKQALVPLNEERRFFRVSAEE